MDARQMAALEMVVDYHNEKHKPQHQDRMRVENLFMLSFDRVGMNWKAIVIPYAGVRCMYEVLYTELTMQTTLNVYSKVETKVKKHY